MRVLLSTYDSRGGVEPLVALAVQLRALGAEALVCAPPDCAERLVEVGVPLVPVGEPVRALVHGASPPSPDAVPRLATELIAAWFDKVAVAAQGCDALVAINSAMSRGTSASDGGVGPCTSERTGSPTGTSGTPTSASRSAQSGGAHTSASAPSAPNRTASATSGSTPPRES